jgi:hypothetical protein
MMKNLLFLLFLYSCNSQERETEIERKVKQINSTIAERSKQNGSFIMQDALATYSWIDWKGEKRRQILYDSAFQLFQIFDWYKNDTREEHYAAYFIHDKVALITVISKVGKKSSGYATYHIENFSILRKDENGSEIDNLKVIIKNLNEDAAKLNTTA